MANIEDRDQRQEANERNQEEIAKNSISNSDNRFNEGPPRRTEKNNNNSSNNNNNWNSEIPKRKLDDNQNMQDNQDSQKRTKRDEDNSLLYEDNTLLNFLFIHILLFLVTSCLFGIYLMI
jgi:hypothetical protein